MNLIDAVKTGKRVRRSVDVPHYGENEFFDVQKDVIALDSKDILAEDWEVEPDAVKAGE